MRDRDHQIWQKLRNESEKAYLGFQYFLKASHPRDLRLIYEDYRAHAHQNVQWHSFLKWYKENDWERRCAAYDFHIADIKAKVDEEERLSERAKRRKILGLLRAKIIDAFDLWTANTPTEMRTFAQIVSVYMEQSRKEYGDYVELPAPSPRLDQIFDIQEELHGAKQFLESLLVEAASAASAESVLELADGKASAGDQVRLVVLGETVQTSED